MLKNTQHLGQYVITSTGSRQTAKGACICENSSNERIHLCVSINTIFPTCSALVGPRMWGCVPPGTHPSHLPTGGDGWGYSWRHGYRSLWPKVDSCDVICVCGRMWRGTRVFSELLCFCSSQIFHRDSCGSEYRFFGRQPLLGLSFWYPAM